MIKTKKYKTTVRYNNGKVTKKNRTEKELIELLNSLNLQTFRPEHLQQMKVGKVMILNMSNAVFEIKRVK